jgi:hypothetical protein
MVDLTDVDIAEFQALYLNETGQENPRAKEKGPGVTPTLG